MGACASSLSADPAESTAPPVDPEEGTQDAPEVTTTSVDADLPSKKSISKTLVKYASWSKRRGTEILKVVYNTPKRAFSLRKKAKGEEADPHPQAEPAPQVIESAQPAESNPVKDASEEPASNANERKLEETITVFGTGATMKVASGRESKDAGSVAGATVLERHNVVVVGEGPELLFLSHGFGTNQQIWGGILEHLDLQNTYKVIMWDLMGAYSTNPEGFNFQRYSTLHGYADDLLEVLDELGVESCTYIGHSVSGMIGVIASVERPKVFKRLVLIGASARYLDSPGYKGGFTLEQLDQVFAAMQENYKVWASGFAPLVIGEDVESPHVREFCRSLFLIRPDIAFSTLRTIFTCDLRHLLPQVSVQVHLLQTARDAAVPWDAVQFMLDSFPNACVEMVPVAGHLPHLTHPETVSDAILRHLAMPLRHKKHYESSAASVASDDAF